MGIKLYSSLSESGGHRVMAEFDAHSMTVAENIFAEVVRGIADRFIEEHYSEIVAQINPTVIAAMASDAAGAAVTEALRGEIKRVRQIAEEARRKASR